MRTRLFSTLLALAGASFVFAGDVVSGPEKGKKIPELKVHALSGPIQGETLDYAKRRKDKATIYLFVREDKFSRPMHGFIKRLAKTTEKKVKGSTVVAVWLTGNKKRTKNYLANTLSSYYTNVALTCYEGAKTGPQPWQINDQADITVVLADKGKVVDCFGYISVNDTVVGNVMKAFIKGTKK